MTTRGKLRNETRGKLRNGTLGKLNSDDFDYTDGFEAVVESEERESIATLPTPQRLVDNYATDGFSKRMGRLITVSPSLLNDLQSSTTAAPGDSDEHPTLITLAPTDSTDLPDPTTPQDVASTSKEEREVVYNPTTAVSVEANTEQVIEIETKRHTPKEKSTSERIVEEKDEVQWAVQNSIFPKISRLPSCNILQGMSSTEGQIAL